MKNKEKERKRSHQLSWREGKLGTAMSKEDKRQKFKALFHPTAVFIEMQRGAVGDHRLFEANFAASVTGKPGALLLQFVLPFWTLKCIGELDKRK